MVGTCGVCGKPNISVVVGMLVRHNPPGEPRNATCTGSGSAAINPGPKATSSSLESHPYTHTEGRLPRVHCKFCNFSTVKAFRTRNHTTSAVKAHQRLLEHLALQHPEEYKRFQALLMDFYTEDGDNA